MRTFETLFNPGGQKSQGENRSSAWKAICSNIRGCGVRPLFLSGFGSLRIFSCRYSKALHGRVAKADYVLCALLNASTNGNKKILHRSYVLHLAFLVCVRTQKLVQQNLDNSETIRIRIKYISIGYIIYPFLDSNLTFISKASYQLTHHQWCSVLLQSSCASFVCCQRIETSSVTWRIAFVLSCGSNTNGYN